MDGISCEAAREQKILALLCRCIRDIATVNKVTEKLHNMVFDLIDVDDAHVDFCLLKSALSFQYSEVYFELFRHCVCINAGYIARILIFDDLFKVAFPLIPSQSVSEE